MRRTKEYEAWCDIKKRCLNTKCKAYKNYGGRGIRMHELWANSYEAFLNDIGYRPDQIFQKANLSFHPQVKTRGKTNHDQNLS